MARHSRDATIVQGVRASVRKMQSWLEPGTEKPVYLTREQIDAFVRHYHFRYKGQRITDLELVGRELKTEVKEHGIR